ncbi:MAG: site-specific integrase [Oligoflexia bacterium]|nr:site-specific integrase [Oligoflexia bacterium]
MSKQSEPVKHYGKWRIRWHDEKGNRKSEVFAKYKEACDALKRYVIESEDVKKGLVLPRPELRSCDELFDYWVEKRAPLKRSGSDDISIIRAHLRPYFGKIKLTDIGTRQIDEFMMTKRHLNKKTSLNHLTLFKTMLNMALDLGWVVRVPKFNKPKINIFSSEYRFLKTKDEINRFLQAAFDSGLNAYSFYATAINTGMRAGELALLRWSDINFEKRIITVQRSFNGPTKGGEMRYVPILDTLLPILKEWKLACPSSTVVFPNNIGNHYTKSGRIFNEVFHRTLEKAQFEKMERNSKLISYIRFHDLRHTFASHWVMNSGDIFKLQKILGHKEIRMTMRYAHLSPEAFSGEYGLLGSHHSPLNTAIILPLKSSLN